MKEQYVELKTDDIKDRLRNASLRVTIPRIAVIRFLHQRGGPISHAEVVDELGASGLDRATVYRNLIDLAKAGLVMRRDLGDHIWRFELQWHHTAEEHRDDHPHFVCSSCGEVRCLPDVEINIATKSITAEQNFPKKKLEVQLRGVCETC